MVIIFMPAKVSSGFKETDVPLLFLPEREPVARIIHEQCFVPVKFPGRRLFESNTFRSELFVGCIQVVALEDPEAERSFLLIPAMI